MRGFAVVPQEDEVGVHTPSRRTAVQKGYTITAKYHGKG